MRIRRASLRPSIAGGGFTLLELMAVLGIFGVLLALSIPPIYRSMDQASSRQYADALASRLRLARAQALSNHTDVIVYFNRDGVGTYTVHVDNGGGAGIPGDPDFDPANRSNGQVDNGEPIMQPIALDARVTFGYVPGGMNGDGDFLNTAISFAGNPPRVAFHADGTSSENGWICVIPLEDFLEQVGGRDFLVETAASTGEIHVIRTVY